MSSLVLPGKIPASCPSCQRLHRGENSYPPTCDAFPKGIPVKIITGANDHREAVSGDHGLRFLPIAENVAE